MGVWHSRLAFAMSGIRDGCLAFAWHSRVAFAWHSRGIRVSGIRVWEQDFMRFSYGYRPNKSAHQAVHSLQMNLQYGSYGYIVEADIKGFFDHMNHDWLLKMLSLRIEDNALLDLINQWLNARIVEPTGRVSKPKAGTPQGGVISPVLANGAFYHDCKEHMNKSLLLIFLIGGIIAIGLKGTYLIYVKKLKPRIGCTFRYWVYWSG